MEQLLPIVVGLIALFIAFKVLKGIIKTVALVVIIALVAAVYFGMFG
ncbi:MAG TPA: hypothetical protein VGC35_06435 [Allosphingosinicella sp.]|jgi:hypothetical protein